MEVVLRQDVDKLGLRGDVVNVARGYARNYLFPRGLAQQATPALVRELEKRDAQRARHEAKSVDEARAIAARLEGVELRFDVNAGPGGTLFGSVTATNVADRLWDELKVRVDRRKIGMDTIKRVGRYTVPVDVFTDVAAALRLVVAPEGVEPPSDQEPEAEGAATAEAEATAQAEATAETAAEAPAAEAVDAEAPRAEAPAEADQSAAELEAAPAPETL